MRRLSALSFGACINPPPVTYTTSGFLRDPSGICTSIESSIDLPPGIVRVAKTTSLIVLISALPQVI
jgi:hypothetical protein